MTKEEFSKLYSHWIYTIEFQASLLKTLKNDDISTELKLSDECYLSAYLEQIDKNSVEVVFSTCNDYGQNVRSISSGVVFSMRDYNLPTIIQELKDDSLIEKIYDCVNFELQ